MSGAACPHRHGARRGRSARVAGASLVRTYCCGRQMSNCRFRAEVFECHPSSMIGGSFFSGRGRIDTAGGREAPVGRRRSRSDNEHGMIGRRRSRPFRGTSVLFTRHGNVCGRGGGISHRPLGVHASALRRWSCAGHLLTICVVVSGCCPGLRCACADGLWQVRGGRRCGERPDRPSDGAARACAGAVRSSAGHVHSPRPAAAPACPPRSRRARARRGTPSRRRR